MGKKLKKGKCHKRKVQKKCPLSCNACHGPWTPADVPAGDKKEWVNKNNKKRKNKWNWGGGASTGENMAPTAENSCGCTEYRDGANKNMLVLCTKLEDGTKINEHKSDSASGAKGWETVVNRICYPTRHSGVNGPVRAETARHGSPGVFCPFDQALCPYAPPSPPPPS